MNGAELPSGHILGVQPAQMQYNSNTKQSMKSPADSGNYTINEASIPILEATKLDAGVVPVALDSSNNYVMMMSNAKKKTPIEEEDDLDDFFASLE